MLLQTNYSTLVDYDKRSLSIADRVLFLLPSALTACRGNALNVIPTAMGIKRIVFFFRRLSSLAFPRQSIKAKPLRGDCLWLGSK